ncbi:MAG TPA: hypothetical protein VEG84_03100 [Thermoanaerobaculia bacterium]|nr:hypothetical protein [Thermoanaerobaculia bacterium]
MPREPGQGPNYDLHDRRDTRLKLDRALANTTRPPARNKRLIAHLQGALREYEADALDHAAKSSS